MKNALPVNLGENESALRCYVENEVNMIMVWLSSVEELDGGFVFFWGESSIGQEGRDRREEFGLDGLFNSPGT